MSEPFIGQIQMWGCNFAPRGWAFCNGQTLSISEYTTLFAVINTFYGGDGRTNFNLPNLSVPSGGARAVLGMGHGPGLSTYPIGQYGGYSSVTLQTSEMPSHTHAWQGNSAPGGVQTPSGNNLGAANFIYTKTASNQIPISPSAVGYAGDGLAHENRQPFQAVNFCIALQGVFPPRN